MELRKLQKKDAPFMLEWMHDANVVRYMHAEFADKTLMDCVDFIEKAQDVQTSNCHMAIVDEQDVYMGTVSLKLLNYRKGTAEFAIAMRRCAMGKGYASYGMKRILELGFFKLNLREIYWCVSSQNQRACHFYHKNGYKMTSNVPMTIRQRYKETGLIWYKALSGQESKAL